MKKHFYSHLIEIDTVYTSLDTLDLTQQEKHELVTIVETSVHHIVLDTVLSELSETDKKKFLAHVATENHTDVWELLKEKVHQVEDKIKQAVEELKANLHEDIKEAHESL